MARSGPSSKSTSDPQELLTSTTVAAFACDESRRITVWNQAAEALLGHKAASVIGNQCFKVICGRDLFGNCFCSEHCAVREMRRHHDPIHPYEFQVMHLSGKMLKVKCSIIVAPSARVRLFSFIHLIEPLDPAPEIGLDEIACRNTAMTDFPLAPSKRATVLSDPSRTLTSREIEVLRLVATGANTEDIASALGIASTTVRNHVQNAISKLGAHNKLQAVCVAHCCGLL